MSAVESMSHANAVECVRFYLQMATSMDPLGDESRLLRDSDGFGELIDAITSRDSATWSSRAILDFLEVECDKHLELEYPVNDQRWWPEGGE